MPACCLELIVVTKLWFSSLEMLCQNLVAAALKFLLVYGFFLSSVTEILLWWVVSGDSLPLENISFLRLQTCLACFHCVSAHCLSALWSVVVCFSAFSVAECEPGVLIWTSELTLPLMINVALLMQVSSTVLYEWIIEEKNVNNYFDILLTEQFFWDKIDSINQENNQINQTQNISFA